jgi:voltage-gated potassium channel Kch
MSSDGESGRHVIVAGYGPVGRVVVDGLVRSGMAVTIVELNRQVCERAEDGLRRTFRCGDIRDEALLREAGVERAAALVLTIPEQEQVIEAVAVARRIAPGIFIAARTEHLSFGMRARAAGADHVVVEELVTAEAMDRAVTTHLLGPAERETH